MPAKTGDSNRIDSRPAAAGNLRRSLIMSMLPSEGAYLDRFKMAREVGFDGIEMATVSDRSTAEEILAASRTTGLTIHSVMNVDHWTCPLSSGDPLVVDRSVAGMETSLRNARLWGAQAVLLVPAIVDRITAYKEAWARSQRVIRDRILPLAKELRIVVALENVWNNFLPSPLEFARYIDEMASPWAQAYLDVGNLLIYGFPQDWIRTLAHRIVRVHLKDFRLDHGSGTFSWKNIGEGDVDWPEVRKALGDIGYGGWVTTEIAGGGTAYLRDVLARVDRFLAGMKPIA